MELGQKNINNLLDDVNKNLEGFNKIMGDLFP